MLSLDNAYNEARAARVRRACPQGRAADRRSSPIAYVAELKIDGLSIALTYEDGRCCAARLAAMARAARMSPPTSAPSGRSRSRCAAARRADRDSRRSVTCRARRSRINREIEEAGRAAVREPRNTAAGTMRNLDPALVSKRNMGAFVYQLEAAGRDGLKAVPYDRDRDDDCGRDDDRGRDDRGRDDRGRDDDCDRERSRSP